MPIHNQPDLLSFHNGKQVCKYLGGDQEAFRHLRLQRNLCGDAGRDAYFQIRAAQAHHILFWVNLYSYMQQDDHRGTRGNGGHQVLNRRA
jgi:hypothetical protein